MSDREFHFEIVIVGAGPAGLAAACAAAQSRKRVALIDDTPWLGGQIWRGQQAKPTIPQAREWIAKFRNSGATLLDRTSIIASPRKGVLLAECSAAVPAAGSSTVSVRESKTGGETPPEPAGVDASATDWPDNPREIHWEQLILATGARELFLPFPGWTLPGVFGPGGLQALVKNGWPIEGKRIVIAGSGPLLLAVADGLKKYGAKIVCVVEQAPWSRVMRFGFGLLAHPDKLLQGIGIKSRLFGVRSHFGAWPVKAEGDEQVRSVTFTDGQRTWSHDCDLFACGFGLVPNVELPLALGCELKNGFVWADQWQGTSEKNVYCAGEPTGVGGADCAITEGQIAGYAATGQNDKAEPLFVQRASWHRFRIALAETFALRDELKSLATNDTLLCRCEDVMLGRVKQFSGWRDAKLQTRCGMGPCQGRVCGAAAKFILGWGMESVRPPVLPARVQSLISTNMTSL
jgi:NADPH-dependent 2,4-dienoyl-CoA reductase/sulfur reductase-like enzyme